MAVAIGHAGAALLSNPGGTASKAGAFRGLHRIKSFLLRTIFVLFQNGLKRFPAPKIAFPTPLQNVLLMSIPTRKCPNCGEAVEGRPNKIYCDNVCKGHHNRSINAELNSESISSSGPTEPTPMHHYPANNLMTRRDEHQEEAEEKANTDQQHASTLHMSFCTLVREVQQLAGKTLPARRIKRLLNDVDSLSTAYIAHPYLKTPHSQDKHRLKALYAMHDTLHDAMEEIADKNMFQSREGTFEIAKKWRKHLRELLIED